MAQNYYMLYRLDMGAWASIFAIPTILIDKHLKLCSENELKFILWVFRHSGEAFDFVAVAQGTGIPPDNVEDCADYWIQEGLVTSSDGTISPALTHSSSEVISSAKKAVIAELPSNEPRHQSIVERKMLRPDGIYIAKRMNECPGLAHILSEAEIILSKTLSPSLSAVLINAHDDYNLPTEVIAMLLTYVKSINKTSTAYIESLTKNWSESSIYTMDDAERKINELNEKLLCWKKVLSATGMSYRTPSKKEEDAAFIWVHDMKIPRELIAEGYERCVDNTGKFSMRYMNKIFEGWNKLNLNTPEAIVEYEKKFKASRESTNKPTYDIGDFDSLNVFDISEK